MELNPETLSVKQRAVLEAVGIIPPEEKKPESEMEWHYRALIRSGVPRGGGETYFVETIEKIECDEIGMTEVGDFVFKNHAQCHDENGGNDLVVPHSSVLWIGRTWKPKAPKVEKVRPLGQYL